jgi:hypothetical protein
VVLIWGSGRATPGGATRGLVGNSLDSPAMNTGGMAVNVQASPKKKHSQQEEIVPLSCRSIYFSSCETVVRVKNVIYGVYMYYL